MRPIFIVEDDPSSILLTKRTLNSADIHNPIIDFSYGSEFILYLEKGNDLPIVILLDLKLPDAHGIDLLRYIRNNLRDEIKRLCVFILTVSDDQQTMVEMIEHGADAFLSKNLQITAFLSALQSCGINLDVA